MVFALENKHQKMKHLEMFAGRVLLYKAARFGVWIRIHDTPRFFSREKISWCMDFWQIFLAFVFRDAQFHTTNQFYTVK